ncbi:unnamed protein product [Pedinophyceae sp. YPF-701]|nr:unnamed protein product [Pedinophyceae sp. YPF-701]
MARDKPSLLFQGRETAQKARDRSPSGTPRSPVSPAYNAGGYLTGPRSGAGGGYLRGLTPGRGEAKPPVRTLHDEIDDHGVDAFGLSHPRQEPSPAWRYDGHGAAARDADNWVTVFGFLAYDAKTVVAEMRRCGDILQHGQYGREGANYMHMQFASPEDVRRALALDGQQITPSLIIGVKPIDPRHKEDVLAYIDTHRTPINPAQRMRSLSPPPRSAPVRPHRVQLDGGTTPLPQPAKSTWGKIASYVFGM